MTLPLEGLKIVDLSRVLAGPLCTMMLGDLGANVIKVERPEVGDDTRGWGPPFAENGESAYFRSVNRNKLSLAASFDVPADLALLRELIAGADVVVENYLPGALRRKGLDRDEILRANSRLVWCTISGFGLSSERPGYDFVVQAESGWMSITGAEAGEPAKVGVALADVIAGKDATIAILAALAGRDRRSAAERHVHVSLQGSAVAALVNVAQNTLVTGVPPKRWGNAHPNLVPYQLFSAADRPFVLAVGNDAQWAQCASVLELADTEHWRTNAGRVHDRETLVPLLARLLSARDAESWMAAFSRVGVPCGLVQSVPEALASVTAHPVYGVVSAVGGSVRFAPPTLDQHGARIRADGWSAFNVTAEVIESPRSVTP
jgi:crotonobetainyl-CoA:carnitine CoA-transferase CaiB-like acyl-CoA transferase